MQSPKYAVVRVARSRQIRNEAGENENNAGNEGEERLQKAEPEAEPGEKVRHYPFAEIFETPITCANVSSLAYPGAIAIGRVSSG